MAYIHPAPLKSTRRMRASTIRSGSKPTGGIRMARDYELGIVVNPDVGDEQARAIVERITHVVATLEGQVVRVNAVGRRRLAYPIDHHRDGLYFYFDLMLGPTS